MTQVRLCTGLQHLLLWLLTSDYTFMKGNRKSLLFVLTLTTTRIGPGTYIIDVMSHFIGSGACCYEMGHCDLKSKLLF